MILKCLAEHGFKLSISPSLESLCVNQFFQALRCRPFYHNLKQGVILRLNSGSKLWKTVLKVSSWNKPIRGFQLRKPINKNIIFEVTKWCFKIVSSSLQYDQIYLQCSRWSLDNLFSKDQLKKSLNDSQRNLIKWTWTGHVMGIRNISDSSD